MLLEIAEIWICTVLNLTVSLAVSDPVHYLTSETPAPLGKQPEEAPKASSCHDVVRLLQVHAKVVMPAPEELPTLAQYDKSNSNRIDG